MRPKHQFGLATPALAHSSHQQNLPHTLLSIHPSEKERISVKLLPKPIINCQIKEKTLNIKRNFHNWNFTKKKKKKNTENEFIRHDNAF
jgi:hypothetical protein